MVRKICLVGVALVLAGCAYKSEILLGDSVSGDKDAVAVNASYSDPEPDAARHCAKYEKTAEFESVTGVWWRWVGGGNKYFYKCKPRPGDTPMDSPAPPS